MKKSVVVSALCVLGLLSIFCSWYIPSSLAQPSSANESVSLAEVRLSEAYDESIKASKAGVSLVVFETRLTDAANHLEQAYNALQSGDLENAALLANESMLISDEVEQEAGVLKEQAETALAENLRLTLGLTIAGLCILLVCGFLGWTLLRNGSLRRNENEGVRGSARHPFAKAIYILLCVSLAIAVLAPSLITLLPKQDVQQFSEFWLLGRNHSARDYPSTVFIGDRYRIYLGVHSHWRYLAYYSINIRLENVTTPLVNAGSQAGDQPLANFRFFLEQDAEWEKEVEFSFENVSFTGNSSLVSVFLINGRRITVDKLSTFDERISAYHYSLVFELWTYNLTGSMLEYNEHLGIMLTLTPTN